MLLSDTRCFASGTAHCSPHSTQHADLSHYTGEVNSDNNSECGYEPVSHLRDIIGHFGDGFYRLDKQTNSAKALKEVSWSVSQWLASGLRLERSWVWRSSVLQLHSVTWRLEQLTTVMAIKQRSWADCLLAVVVPAGPTQPSIHPGSVNKDQLRLGGQRLVWFIPFMDKCVGVQVKLKSLDNACHTWALLQLCSFAKGRYDLYLFTFNAT